MNCPSCYHSNPDGAVFCGRCRLSFTSRNLFLSRFHNHLFWILRRAGAGFVSGTIAWFFIPALSRVLAQSAPPLFHFFTSGLLGGAFLGSVDGMMEESTPKTVNGAVMGGLGGALGGLLFGYLNTILPADQTAWALFAFWAVGGGFIGVVSAIWERRAKKIIAGAVSGIIGGGVGGALGYILYANLTPQIQAHGWFLKRLAEGLSGGILGVTLWFAIGAAERFIIFKRKTVEGMNHKHCDLCEKQNPLNMWYCGQCGAVLQQSAPPGKLNLSPYETLDRIKEMFHFLSRLCSTTGVIAGVVIFIIFVPVNSFLALISVILVAVLSYSCQVLFSSCAESIEIFIKK